MRGKRFKLRWGLGDDDLERPDAMPGRSSNLRSGLNLDEGLVSPRGRFPDRPAPYEDYSRFPEGDLEIALQNLSPQEIREVARQGHQRQRAQVGAQVADVAYRLDPDRQAAWAQLRDSLSGLGGLARNVALPAAVLAPAALTAASQDEQYGGAGAATGAAGSLIGAGIGQGYGAQLGELAAPGRGRLAGRILGALLGSGVGGGAAGLVNAGAGRLVTKAEAGETGIGAEIGRALDAIGYESEQDRQAAAIARAESMPLYQEMQMAERRRKEAERAAMIENLYYTMMANA